MFYIDNAKIRNETYTRYALLVAHGEIKGRRGAKKRPMEHVRRMTYYPGLPSSTFPYADCRNELPALSDRFPTMVAF